MSTKESIVHCLGDIRHTDTYWYSMIKNAICKEATRRVLGVLISECSDNEPISDFLGDTEIREPVLIISGRRQWVMNHTAEVTKLSRRPILLASGLYTGGRDVSTVNVNYAEVTYDIIRYLCGAERRKIAYFARNIRSLADNAKLTGITEAASDFGLDFSEHDVFTFDGSLSACFDRFETHKTSYDAVLCSNDITAIYLMRRLIGKGICIPEDIAVIGYGNTALGQIVSPKLTTTTLNFTDVGICAVDTYRALLANDRIRSIDTVLRGEIIFRDTTPKSTTEPVQPLSPVSIPVKTTETMSFFGDSDVLDILRLEDYFSTHDAIDGKIAAALLSGEKYDSICEHLHTSDSMLKNHIRSLSGFLGAANRTELCDMLGKVLDGILN